MKRGAANSAHVPRGSRSRHREDRQWPDSGPLFEGLPAELLVRRVPVSRFPYYLAYLVTSDAIHVLAIAHERRRPGYWSGRTPH